jgi:hypothetical protein
MKANSRNSVRQLLQVLKHIGGPNAPVCVGADVASIGGRRRGDRVVNTEDE